MTTEFRPKDFFRTAPFVSTSFDFSLKRIFKINCRFIVSLILIRGKNQLTQRSNSITIVNDDQEASCDSSNFVAYFDNENCSRFCFHPWKNPVIKTRHQLDCRKVETSRILAVGDRGTSNLDLLNDSINRSSNTF
jgi:hypothetical protein